MANTSSRSLRRLSLLQNHRYWSGVELAERESGGGELLVRGRGIRLHPVGQCPIGGERGDDDQHLG